MTVLARLYSRIFPHHEEQDEDRLVDVSLTERPVTELRPDTILCVNIHENETALTRAVEYSREVRRPKPGTQIRSIPRLFALVNFRVLSPKELWKVNNELIPAGASIFPYPDGCDTFDEAKTALKEQLSIARREYAAARTRLEILASAQGQAAIVAATPSQRAGMKASE